MATATPPSSLGFGAPMSSSEAPRPSNLHSLTRAMIGPVSLIGTGRRRLEGGEKVAGATRFTADLQLPGLLYVQLVLSHLPSATIRSIDTKAARSAPGVVDVVTGADLPEVSEPSPMKPLAVGRVFFVGQPVVAVIAESETAASDAAALVEVDYEPMPSIVDPEAAMRDGAEQVLEADEAGGGDDAAMHGAGTDANSEAAPARRPPHASPAVSMQRRQ